MKESSVKELARLTLRMAELLAEVVEDCVQCDYCMRVKDLMGADYHCERIVVALDNYCSLRNQLLCIKKNMEEKK